MLTDIEAATMRNLRLCADKSRKVWTANMYDTWAVSGKQMKSVFQSLESKGMIKYYGYEIHLT